MPRVLIIDDDEALRKMIRFRLRNSYSVLDTASPEEGVVLALEHKPDVILVDLMMGSQTGFGVCQGLTALSMTEHIPVFVISGAPKALYKDFCQALGAKGYFEKPIDFETLESQLAAALNRVHEQRRTEPRIRMRLGVKLCGKDQKGVPFEMFSTTENVSRHGFCCGVNVPLDPNDLVELFLWTRTARRFAGRARLVWLDWPETALMPRCGFRFVEEPREWIF